ncbi:T9SS type A sorting domain-containing protein [Reichenbachiella agariperforans]|uniref:T9SS type A sorting domain-containing protein n=1 Tax=Reichenbachiella agariperforans TaxID=156994 RepID=UPI001C0A3207|nr:T9SS type A sorting domain-containing protein [Reichenbachiella agariperforans]MBU2913443.1 T9SS type A sorting domain-containing protein [Reichenbachiella agariperforans]
MKSKLIIIAVISLIILQLPERASGQTNVSGTLTTDTEWAIEGSPYILTSTVGVLSGVTLTINKGVEIQGNFDLLVKGTITINGILGDSVEFSQTRLIFKSTNLSNSEINYVKYSNSSGVQLADEAEHNQDGVKNSGILTVANSNFNDNAYARTKGYDSGAKLILSNCSLINSIVKGYYPRTEVIEIIGCDIKSSTLNSASYNFGIYLNDTKIDNGQFTIGCCGSNINLDNCEVNNSSFSDYNDWYNVNIDNSIVTNTTFDLTSGHLTISNSRVIAGEGTTNHIAAETVELSNSIFDGNQSEFGVKIYGYQGINGRNSSIQNCTFQNYQNVISVERFNSFDFKQNNLIDISGYSLVNNWPSNIDATENYWGTDDENIIATQIFDGLDDINSGIVDFSSYLTSPTADAPMTAPMNIYKGLQNNGVLISWNANEEANLAGYKIYSKSNQSDDFTLLADVGNVTSYFSDQIINSDLLVIKSYSDQADGTSDLLEGNESVYSEYAEDYISDMSISSSTLCESEMLEVDLNSSYNFSVNYFILQLSDVNGSFDNAINLDSTLVATETLSSTLPDTLQFGETYLTRVLSSELNVYSNSSEVTLYEIPNSAFNSIQESCQSDTVVLQYSNKLLDGLALTWNLDGGQILENIQDSLLKVKWPSFGIKEISLEAIHNGCTNTTTQSINIIKTPTTDFSVQSYICHGETAFISYIGNGADTATYSWDFDGGTIISGDDTEPFEISWDSYGTKNLSLRIFENGCSSETAIQTIEYNEYPNLSFEAKESVCYNENYQIDFVGSNYTDVSWDFNGANIISGSGTGPYLLNWNNSGQKYINFSAFNNGCLADTTIVINIPSQPYTPEICMVTVDEESSKNMLIWSYELETVNQFGIYRETNVSGGYSLVEFVDGGMSNSYIDTQSSPEQQSNRYKITSLDSCGTETDLSSYHKTIHLTINKGLGTSWNLIWDAYEGFSFGTYRIYRSLDGDGFEVLTEIASNLSSYTDSDVTTSDVAYQIEVLNPNNCETNSGGRILENSTSRSNIARTNSVLAIPKLENTITLFPNPTTDYVFIELGSSLNGVYELSTITGQTLYSGILTQNSEVDMTSIPSGIYLITLKTNKGIISKRIVRE